MQELSKKVDLIINKVSVLGGENFRLESENIDLKEKIIKLQEQISEKDLEIGKLNEKLRLVKNAKSMHMSDDERKEFKTKINHYIKDIDVCIEMLST